MKKYKLFFSLSFICFIISGISILCVPITNVYGTGISKVMVYIVACVFWIGIIGEFVFFNKANSLRRILERKSRSKNTTISSNTGIGVVSFFKNREAKICDVILFISVALFAFLSVFKIDIEWLIIISAALLFLSFNLHCFFNGKNYRYIKSYINYTDSEEHQENE